MTGPSRTTKHSDSNAPSIRIEIVIISGVH